MEMIIRAGSKTFNISRGGKVCTQVRQSSGGEYIPTNPHHNGQGTAARDAAYKETYDRTKDHKAVVASYVNGNIHAEETAKNTGNMYESV
jgi:hypothetical protein